MAVTIQHSQGNSLSNTCDGVRSKYRNEAARQLLKEWREDTSGYDEKAWPKVKQLIEENRLSVRQ